MPLVLTALSCVALFGFLQSIARGAPVAPYLQVLAVFMVVMMFYAIYSYSGETKNILWYIVPGALTYWQLQHTFNYYAYVFRVILPGDTRKVSGFAQSFVANFFGAGLCEELFKATPALIALGIAWLIRRSGGPIGRVDRGLAIEGPLDGLLFGAVAGAAFIVDETVFGYVERIMRSFNSVETGQFFGLALLIPRVLQGVIGHMAWAGIFGYFIGLSATHPRAAWKLLPLGWLVAGCLHAFWNSFSAISPDLGLYLSAAVTLPVFFACLLKARQLEAVRLGWPVEGRSILPGPEGPPPSGLATAVAGLTTVLERSVGVTARQTAPTAKAPMAPTAVAPGLSVGVGERAYALLPGQIMDFSTLFQGGPGPLLGIVGVSPDGCLQVRNAGSATWAMLEPDGAGAAVPPGGSFRPHEGLRLVAGDVTIAIKAY